jgi:hypothetical protein
MRWRGHEGLFRFDYGVIIAVSRTAGIGATSPSARVAANDRFPHLSSHWFLLSRASDIVDTFLQHLRAEQDQFLIELQGYNSGKMRLGTRPELGGT